MSAPPGSPLAAPLVRWVATGFGSGLLPVAPGTWGSAVGLALGAIAVAVAGPTGFLVLTAIAVIGGHLATVAYMKTGDRSDPPEVVVDEIAGQLVAALPIALGAVALGALGWALAFALFRFFDIVKPGPVRWAERAPGAAGVMADDLVAGAAAAACLVLIGGAIHGF